MNIVYWMFMGLMIVLVAWAIFFPRREKVKLISKDKTKEGQAEPLTEASDPFQPGIVCGYEKEAYEKDGSFLPVVQFFHEGQEILVTAPNFQYEGQALLKNLEAVRVYYDSENDRAFVER